MGILLERGLPCPKCTSSDAYSEYDENFHCFSCHYTKTKRPHERKKVILPRGPEIALPQDFDTELPPTAAAHLYKHHFTDELIQRYCIGYSESSPVWSNRKEAWVRTGPRLLLPGFIDGHLKYWEGRALAPKEHQPQKYITCGGKEDLFVSRGYDFPVDSVVVVEDILSAMRVGETMPCVALRGTNLTDEKLIALSKLAKCFIVWLDSDRAGQEAAIKIGTRLTWAGKVCYCYSERDPKCYSDLEIETLLKGVGHEKPSTTEAE